MWSIVRKRIICTIGHAPSNSNKDLRLVQNDQIMNSDGSKGDHSTKQQWTFSNSGEWVCIVYTWIETLVSHLTFQIVNHEINQTSKTPPMPNFPIRCGPCRSSDLRFGTRANFRAVPATVASPAALFATHTSGVPENRECDGVWRIVFSLGFFVATKKGLSVPWRSCWHLGFLVRFW